MYHLSREKGNKEMEDRFLEDFYAENRMVAFLSHRVCVGKYKENVESIYALAKELTEMGFTVIRATTLAPWLVDKNGKEVNPHVSMRIRQSVILIAGCLIYDVNKQSIKTKEEMDFARKHKVPILEIHYLRGLMKK